MLHPLLLVGREVVSLCPYKKGEGKDAENLQFPVKGMKTVSYLSLFWLLAAHIVSLESLGVKAHKGAVAFIYTDRELVVKRAPTFKLNA